MATKTKVQNLRASSPLMHMAGGTKKTERRRSRSRSRQRIESELAKKIDDIPIIHDTMEYLLSTYSLIKDSNPLLKESLQRSENIAFWMKQKAEDIVVATKMDQPLKQIDTMAARTLEEMEKTRKKIGDQWETNNKVWQARVRGMSREVQKKTEGINYTIFEAIQTLMDYVEETLEQVMVPPTPESAKFSEDPSFKMTMGRMLDITYRLNVGLMGLSIERVKEMGDPDAWVKAATPHLDPRQLSLRAQIISHEIAAPPGKQLGYMENKELTELDRQLIMTSRALLAASKVSLDQMARGPNMAMEMMANMWLYNKEILQQLSEARSMRDLTGIGIHETKRALEAARENLSLLKQSDFLNQTVQWLATQERNISTSGSKKK